METYYEPHYSLYLGEKSEPYSEGKGLQHKAPIKLGQRKLFFVTLAFLKKLPKKGTIVYVGAAGGANIVSLIMLFPYHVFVLFDPNKFNPKLVSMSRVCSFKQLQNYRFLKGSYIIQEYFTDDCCNFFSKLDNVYFISDIRTGNRDTHDKIDIPLNMAWQKNWYHAMKPAAALLKFRLPWTPGKTSYLQGQIMLQPRIGSKSSETRLEIGPYNPVEVEYDHDDYNNRLYYFHTHQRMAYHEHDIQLPGYCHCYDCWAESKIVENMPAHILKNKYIGDINVSPHNIDINNRDTEARLEGMKDEIFKYKKRVLLKITPRTGQKVYVLRDGTEILKPAEFYIPGEEKISNMEKYRVEDENLLN